MLRMLTPTHQLHLVADNDSIGRLCSLASAIMEERHHTMARFVGRFRRADAPSDLTFTRITAEDTPSFDYGGFVGRR